MHGAVMTHHTCRAGRSLAAHRKKPTSRGYTRRGPGKKRGTQKKTRKLSLDTITTDEVTCIARTTVREVVRTADAEVHAAAGAKFPALFHAHFLAVLARNEERRSNLYQIYIHIQG
jgi:hypothetical protein